MTIANAIARARTDSTYRVRLLNEPQEALAESGVEVPEGTTVKVVENTALVRHLVIPMPTANASEASSEELERVVDGGAIYGSGPLRSPMESHDASSARSKQVG